MKTLNQCIREYTCLLQQGDIQIAYKGILAFIHKLQADFIKQFPQYQTGSVYQGYMDMSYFSLSTTLLKDKGLKIAVVYLHETGAFEAWLSAQNRETAKKYASVLARSTSDIALFHDSNNPDALLEYTLASAPDFEEQAASIEQIKQHIQMFITAITALLP